MLNLNPDYRYFYVEGITDMRLGHFRLCNTIREMLGRDPYNGDVFITMSKKRDKVKLVRYENHAYTVFMKAYEHGFQFLVPKPSEEGKTSYQLSLSKLQALMECTARREIKI